MKLFFQQNKYHILSLTLLLILAYMTTSLLVDISSLFLQQVKHSKPLVIFYSFFTFIFYVGLVSKVKLLPPLYVVDTKLGNIDTLQSPTFCISKDLQVQYANSEALRVLGKHSLSEVINAQLKDIFHLSSAQKLELVCESAVKSQVEILTSYQFIDSSGSTKTYTCVAYFRKKCDDIILMLLSTNISAITSSTDLRHDHLTGFLNRSALRQVIDESLENTTSSTLLLIDIDQFQSINDVFGQKNGDTVLQATAAKLQSILRKSDTVARYGGDVFAVFLLGEASEAGINSLISKIQDLLRLPVKLYDQGIALRASIGVASTPENGQTAEEICRSAELALKHTKMTNRCSYTKFSESLARVSEESYLVAAELPVAIENQQFEVYYQPQVSASTHQVLGAEALLRWTHPMLGSISPEVFIPMAEANGDIVEIGFWVLDEACSQLKQWNRLGYNISISVNVSPKQLLIEKFHESVQYVLSKYEIDPCYLELEVTEQIFASNFPQIITNLKKLAEAGVKLSIDDFGAGYASFAYLQAFPVSKLKIDKMFTQDFLSNRTSSVIVEMTLMMSKALELEVTAEGVEELSQAERLDELGCSLLQGFFFSKPVRSAEFLAYLKASE